MHRIPIVTNLVGALLVAGILIGLASSPASAQWSPRVGIGYVANAPNQFLGFSAHALTMRWGGLGLYVDAKVDHTTPREESNFDPTITAQQVDDELGHPWFADDETYRSINLALMRPVTPELIVYGGAGYTEREVFVEYVDSEQERGLGGVYWVEDPDARASGLNVLFGGLFRIGPNMALQFGVETQPRGATVGATFAVPLGR